MFTILQQHHGNWRQSVIHLLWTSYLIWHYYITGCCFSPQYHLQQDTWLPCLWNHCGYAHLSMETLLFADVIRQYTTSHHHYYCMSNNLRYDVFSSTILWKFPTNCQVTLQDNFTIPYEHSSSDTYIDWISSFASYEHGHSQLYESHSSSCRIWNHEYISRRIWTLIYLHIYTPTTGMFHKLHLFAEYGTNYFSNYSRWCHNIISPNTDRLLPNYFIMNSYNKAITLLLFHCIYIFMTSRRHINIVLTFMMQHCIVTFLCMYILCINMCASTHARITCTFYCRFHFLLIWRPCATRA